ncbi:MAG TPA: ferritin [Clostridiaceae bacterium]
MLNKIITSLINDQINKEFYSSYFYLDIYSFFSSKNLNGFANWFFVQTQEEKDHALLFMKYLLNNSEEVTLRDIKAVNMKFTTFDTPLEATLEHERVVTESINNIYAEAISIKDFRSMQFLDWFIKEQGEEEKNSEDVIKRYELFGNDSKGLYLLDAELALRVYAPPTLII